MLGFALGWFAAVRQRPDAVGDAKDVEPATEALHESPLRSDAEPREKRVVDRAILAELASVEDEILRDFEARYRRWHERSDDHELTEQKSRGEEIYRAFLRLSDELVESFFTPEVIATLPWQDLLTQERAVQWRGPTLQGFEFHIENGVLRMVNTGAASGSAGVISIGDAEIWRDFELEIELSVKRGECWLFFRLPPSWQENVLEYDLIPWEDDPEPGRPHTYSFRVLGSTLTIAIGNDGLDPEVKPVSWTRIRKGALGIAVPTDSEVEITRLRIRLLRPSD